ncbi:MAG: LysR family transcriptional regulator [Actinobacteria bacterium]|nr:LysR family transcriptional regulator [Actinomycetota bacterium]
MELHQLAYLVAVADAQSFTKAAEKLLVSQPGVSAQIRRLERELGEELLDRSGRSVRPTAVGAAVLPYARAALTAVDGARLAVSEMTGLLRGRAAIGTVTSPNVDLASLLAEFHDLHPMVEISLSSGDTDQLAEHLQAGELDAAILSVGATLPAGVAAQVLVDQPIVAAVGHQHDLASHGVVALANLADYPLISLPRGSGLRARIDEAFAAAGLSPHVAFEVSTPEVVADLAARGLGVAFLPGPFAEFRKDRLAVLRIDPPELRGRLVLAWRASGPTSPAGRGLISHVRDALAAH